MEGASTHLVPLSLSLVTCLAPHLLKFILCLYLVYGKSRALFYTINMEVFHIKIKGVVKPDPTPAPDAAGTTTTPTEIKK